MEMNNTFGPLDELDLIQQLVKPEKTKILMVVMDGVGGLPKEEGGKTELEAANTPNLDALAARSICGLHTLGPGITPGSGPGHLGLFGYDPFQYQVGRGVLSALGINFDLKKGDVAARGNFCTLGEDGLVKDRRAGRLATEKNQELSSQLQQIKLPGVEVFVQPVKDYRFLLVLRGKGLSGDVEDTDPQEVGEKPLRPIARNDSALKTAELVGQFIDQAREILKDHHPANMILLRGFATPPDWPTMQTAFGLNPAVIAVYPMYRGVAKLVGMKVLQTGSSFEEEVDTLEQHWQSHDFFFLHFKPIDSAGEDGDFDRKAGIIEDVDRLIPRLMDLKPDVVIVTGDHSTPAAMLYHGWQPVPVLIWSKFCRPDGVQSFGERACMLGGLGPRLPAKHIMPIALANARRLDKFGA
jgi:2,3-bisphosphoglycerate-independent phosphoglycerate mutase